MLGIWGFRLKVLVLFVFLCTSITSFAKGEKIAFMLEERLGSSMIYCGWSNIKNLIYRPNFIEIENMFQLAQGSKNIGDLNFTLKIDEIRLQYVLFEGNSVGIVMEGKIDRQDHLITCFVYSRVDLTQMNWTLNNYKCEE